MTFVAKRRFSIAMLAAWLAACGLGLGQETVPELQQKLEFQKKLDLQKKLQLEKLEAEKKKRDSQKKSFEPPLIQPVIPRFPSPGVTPVPSPRVTTPVFPAEPVRPIAATPEQIAGWIHELDAIEFDTRETAMLHLIDVGSAVLPVLKPVLTKGSLEATSRGLFIVRQLGLAANMDAQDEAGQFLNELAEQAELPTLARRAAATLVDLTQQRSTQAVAALELLGAKISRVQLDANNPQDERVNSIHVDDKFQGEETDLRRLQWIIDVPVLILSGTQVTDDWIKRAVVMSNLQGLHLYQAKISDAGLLPLTDHASLREIGIYHTPVRDAALQPLVKLPLLAFVKLYGTQVTKEGAEKFKADSGMAVDFRRGAFMGVGGQEIEGRCLITTVHRGSPADKAGITPNDTIVRFGGAEVTSFSKLTDLIAPREFGEEVEVEVLRPVLDGQVPYKTVTAKVTLAAWEVDNAVQNARPNR